MTICFKLNNVNCSTIVSVFVEVQGRSRKYSHAIYWGSRGTTYDMILSAAIQTSANRCTLLSKSPTVYLSQGV